MVDKSTDEKSELDRVAKPRMIRIEPASTDEETLTNDESAMLRPSEDVEVTTEESDRISVNVLLVIVRQGVKVFVACADVDVMESNSEDFDKARSVSEQFMREMDEELQRSKDV